MKFIQKNYLSFIFFAFASVAMSSFSFANAKIKNGDQLGLLFVNHFNKHGVKAQYFLRKNDGRATGITYHIGHLIHGSENGTEVKGLKTAWELVPEVIKQMKIGYARVSTTKQNLDRQIAALRSEGCEQIYRDKASGKSMKGRPELDEAIDALREIARDFGVSHPTISRLRSV